MVAPMGRAGGASAGRFVARPPHRAGPVSDALDAPAGIGRAPRRRRVRAVAGAPKSGGIPTDLPFVTPRPALLALLLFASPSEDAPAPVADAGGIVIRSDDGGRLSVHGPALVPAPRDPEPLPPIDETAVATTLGLLGPGFRALESRRFVVLSDCAPSAMREQLERLERTHHQFGRFVRRLGLEVGPIRRKLICILFEDRAAYRAFARLRDDVRDPWIAGYYAPATDRIVFYCGSDNPSVVEARARLASMRDDVVAIADEARRARVEGRRDRAEQLELHRHACIDHLERETRRIDAFEHQVAAATTLHEAFHQLAFHTGLQSARVQYPIWISEGLATAFESDRPGEAFGPEHEYAPRREGFVTLLAEGAMIPLRDLVARASAADADDATVNAIYHQSYALVTWLARRARPGLVRYLEALRREPTGRVAPHRAVALFEEAFGDADALEARWLADERDRAGIESPAAE